MKFEQFTYTGSPWGATAPGWTIFQSSAGIRPEEASALKPYFQFKDCSGDADFATGEVDGRRLPIRLIYANAPMTGRRVMAQSLDAGLRWYDQTRGHDYFAHVFTGMEADFDLKGFPVWFNPMALFLSPSIQTEFPMEFREKALQILNGDRPNESPPDLPALDSLSEIEPNESFSDEILFSRLSQKTIENLGRFVSCIVRKNRNPLIFDATRPESIDCMAAIIRLAPLSLRVKLNFSTWIPENETRTFPGFSAFSFYGTVREGESADPDTGLYGELPQGELEFRSREDVELFKRMVDAGGAELKAEDFDSLVLCWEVASARKKDVASLREAMRFADRFPGLREEVVTGLASSTSDSLVSVVAWFEFSLSAYEDSARQVCSDCVRDGSFFAEVLRTLDSDEARQAFADAVAKDAESSGCVSELAAMWLGCGQDVRALLARNVTGPFVSIAALADRYDAIRRDVAAKSVDPSRAAAMLAEVEKAARKLGDDFEGIEDTRNSLRYLVALVGLKDVDGLASFAESIRGLGVDGAKVRADVLARVKPGDIPVERLAKLMGAFEVVGIPREDVLRLAVEAAEQRGRDAAKRKGHHRAREAEMRTNDVDHRSGIPMWLSAVLAVVALMLGLAVGWTFRSLHGIGKTAADKPCQERELPDLPTIENGGANKADAVQGIEDTDILTDALQLQGDGQPFMKGTQPQDMQPQNEQQHFEAIESSRLSSPKEPFPQMESPQSQSEVPALPGEMPKQQQSDESASPQVQQQPEEQLQPSEAPQNMHRQNLLEERREPMPVMPQKPPVEGIMIIHVEEQRVGW